MTYCPFEIDLDPATFGLETRAVPTRYGAVMVRVSPDRRGDTATLYIHGVGADWTTWTPLLRAEAQLNLSTHDQVLINLPGFGDSVNRLDELDIIELGDIFLSITRDLGYSKVRIVGHSMGGFLTLDMASRHSDLVDSIHLAAGPYFSILHTIQHPLRSFRHSASVAAVFGSQHTLARTGRLGTTAIHALCRIGLFRPLLLPFAAHPYQLKDSVVRALCEQYNPRGLLQTAANGPGYDADRQWAAITCPIWATFGEYDRLVPRMDMARLLDCQPNAICTTIRDASHLHHIERPREVVQALKLWE